MNWKLFKKNNKGKLVRLHPPAKFGEHTLDDDWIITGFPTENSFELSHVTTGIACAVGRDVYYGYTEDPQRTREDLNGSVHAFLTLRGQIFVMNGRAEMRLSSRPGEVVGQRQPPAWTDIVAVDTSNFAPPIASHIQIQYKLWSDDDRVPLSIAIGTSDYRPALLEYSGLSGVADIMLTNGLMLYVSVAHPHIKWQLDCIGYTLNL
jgi:hypothetical protein